MRVLIGRDEMPRRRFTVRFLWEPRDLWLGVFWNTVRFGGRPGRNAARFLFIYICIVPCLPLALVWRRPANSHPEPK